MADSLFETLLQIQTDVAHVLINVYIPLYGVTCDVFYPITRDSIYGEHGRSVVYNQNPDETSKKILILGFIKDNALAGVPYSDFDNFYKSGEQRPFILTYEALRLPINTKITAKIGTGRFYFRTEIDEVITGYGDNILIRQYLEPVI